MEWKRLYLDRERLLHVLLTLLLLWFDHVSDLAAGALTGL